MSISNWLKRLFSRPSGKIKPCGTIDYALVDAIVRAKAEEIEDRDYEVYIPDTANKVYRKDDVIKSEELREVSSIPYVSEEHDCIYDLELAYGLGLFFADGSCGLRNGKYNGAFWRIVNRKKDCLERARKAFERSYPGLTFPIRLYDSYRMGANTGNPKFTRRKDLYCLEVAPKERHNDGIRGKFIKEFTDMSYSNGSKKVYKEMWGSASSIKKSFLEGVIDGDGSIKNDHRGQITCHGHVALAGLIDMLIDCGWKFHIIPEKGDTNFCISYNKVTEKLAPTPACDDFAAELFGKFAGLIWTNHHAFNWFIDETDTFWYIEPQTKKLSQTIEGWQGNDIRFFLGR